MTGWIIFGSIVLFLVWLFTRSVTVYAKYENKLDIRVKFLFIKLYPTRPRRAKRKKPKKQRSVSLTVNETDSGEDEPDESGEDGEIGGDAEKSPAKGKSAAKKTAKKPKKKLGLDIEQIVDYVKSASPPVKRLLRKIKFVGLRLDYVVGTDDAAKTALKYGGLCAAVYPFLEWLRSVFTVKVKRIKISADFSREKDDVSAFCKIRLRVSTAVFCALWLAVRLVKTYLKYNGKKTPEKNAKPARA